MLTVTAAQEEFAPRGTYLNTASLGLPPARTLDALRHALDDWRVGAAQAPDYDAPLDSARRTYSRLVGVQPEQVAVGSQVSAFAGLVAAALPDGAEVLTAERDFTSILFPFLAQHARGVTVRSVPLDGVAEHVRDQTTLVSVSAVQSADGAVADLDALEQACAATGTDVLLDTTQAIGWLPLDASRFAYTVCAGYKWLLTPRGTAYLTVRPDRRLDHLVPHLAGWYAGEDPWTSIYGPPLRLAPDARRFDVSPVWHSWVGAQPALALLEDVGTRQLHTHAVGLANRFRDGVGMPATDSAIVSVAVAESATAALATGGVTAAMRDGRLRLSFHLHNRDADADHAATVLRPHLASP